MRNQPEQIPKWKRLLGGVFYGAFLLIVFLVATGAGWVSQSGLMKEMAIGFLYPRDPREVFQGDSVTLLVLGCDQDLSDTYSLAYRKELARKFLETGERPHVSKAVGRSRARTDMMMVAKMDFTNHTITGVSIPRDIELSLPGYRPMKMNAFYSIAPKGQEKDLTRRAVEYLLPGVHIDRVVTLDYDAFQEVVDMVGGVPLDVSKPMKYVDAGGGLFINLKPGHQVLNGYDAMGFVRFRHDDSDFERQKRQKEFMVSLKQQIMSPSNLPALPGILNQAKQVFGTALSDKEIAGLAGFAKTVPPQNIRLGMVPVLEQKHSTFLHVDQRKLPEVLAEHGLTPTVDEPRGSTR
jgi:LCP family protein required for cell wall assembly